MPDQRPCVAAPPPERGAGPDFVPLVPSARGWGTKTTVSVDLVPHPGRRGGCGTKSPPVTPPLLPSTPISTRSTRNPRAERSAGAGRGAARRRRAAARDPGAGRPALQLGAGGAVVPAHLHVAAGEAGAGQRAGALAP